MSHEALLCHCSYTVCTSLCPAGKLLLCENVHYLETQEFLFLSSQKISCFSIYIVYCIYIVYMYIAHILEGKIKISVTTWSLLHETVHALDICFNSSSTCTYTEHMTCWKPQWVPTAARVTLQQLCRLWMIGKLFLHSLKCHKWIIHVFTFQALKYSTVLHQASPLRVIASNTSDVFAGQGSITHSMRRLVKRHICICIKKCVAICWIYILKIW